MSNRESRLRVLLLDDDPDDRALARFVLERELPQLAVGEAADALAFARACGARSFDLVILAPELRWADGLAVLAALKEDRPEVPVILFARPGSDEAALKAIRLGADDYLIKKPADFLRLPPAVRRALHRERPGKEAAGGRQAEEEGARRLAQLQRSNEELLQFASTAAHELQEPVRMMERYARLLAEELAGQLGAGGSELVEVIVAAARRLRLLIENLLALSRVESRKRTVETARAEELLAQALANLQAAIEESGATIEHSGLPEIAADPAQIVQLFQNLIGNAIKFRGAEAPRVHVSAEQGADEWVFAVRDNGIGMSPAEVEAIFTIFKRLHPEVPGSGIGLALCRKIVERHGGRLWVESQPGGGSTFYFTLPSRSRA